MATVEELQQQVQALQTQLTETIAESKKYRQRAQTAEEQQKAESQRAADAQAKLDAAEAERKKLELESKGKYDEALKQTTEAHQKALAAETARRATVEQALNQTVGQNALLTALGKAGLKPDLIGQAARLVAGQVRVEVKDGQAVIQVLDEAGKPLLKADGTPAGVEELATGFAKNNPHYLPPTGDTGTGAHRGAPGGVTLAELDADPEKKSKFIQEQGTGAYLKLAAASQEQKKG